jgi:bifunctional non-homologous end joining protein LigD
VLYPELGLTKAHLVTYYAAVAPFMLPHVAQRPLTLLRCPDGSGRPCFLQKHIQGASPAAIQRVSIREAHGQGTYGTIRDVDGLVALAQLGVLEVHVWNSRAPALERPDQLVFDLDPDEGLAWERVVEAALALRERLSALGLTSFVKTTGGKGLHVVAPLARGLDWERHLALARGLALELVQETKGRFVVDMRKSARKGKVFLDYLRNARAATAVAPYSTRARPSAPIATPMHWDELKAGVRPESFDLRGVVRRLERPTRDPWEGFAELSQALPAAELRRLVALGSHIGAHEGS